MASCLDHSEVTRLSAEVPAVVLSCQPAAPPWAATCPPRQTWARSGPTSRGPALFCFIVCTLAGSGGSSHPTLGPLSPSVPLYWISPQLVISCHPAQVQGPSFPPWHLPVVWVASLSQCCCLLATLGGPSFLGDSGPHLSPIASSSPPCPLDARLCACDGVPSVPGIYVREVQPLQGKVHK